MMSRRWLFTRTRWTLFISGELVLDSAETSTTSGSTRRGEARRGIDSRLSLEGLFDFRVPGFDIVIRRWEIWRREAKAPPGVPPRRARVPRDLGLSRSTPAFPRVVGDGVETHEGMRDVVNPSDLSNDLAVTIPIVQLAENFQSLSRRETASIQSSDTSRVRAFLYIHTLTRGTIRCDVTRARRSGAGDRARAHTPPRVARSRARRRVARTARDRSRASTERWIERKRARTAARARRRGLIIRSAGPPRIFRARDVARWSLGR